jgi:acetyltransferase-like isoleucine patch superfamily enzyme
MNLVIALFWRVHRSYRGLKRRWYGWRFVVFERPQHAVLEVGRDSSFHVPVRGGGKGCIRIGDQSCFGDASGYRSGSGEISLFTNRAESEIVIGNRCFLNNNVSIGAMKRVVIGDDCLIAGSVAIADCDFHDINPETRRQSQGTADPVLIGRNVWLGTGVTVLKGVSIGDNSVVGARSVVTKSIPANCVAVGNPARIIRVLNSASLAPDGALGTENDLRAAEVRSAPAPEGRRERRLK